MAATLNNGAGAVAAGYDSDEEPRDDDVHQLSWRLPPEESHSDWTILIVSSNNDRHHPEADTAQGDENAAAQVEEYHIHKCIVAVGSRRSEYFGRLFQSHAFREAQSHTSRIVLHPLAARVFPVLLDYLYGTGSSNIPFSTNTATALHYLGQYFEIRRLRWQAKQFWKRDLQLSNCHTYYLHAKIFNDDKILQAVAACCRKRILDISPSCSLVQEILQPDFWPCILENLETALRPRMAESVWLTVQSNLNICRQQSLHASCLVTESCKLHKDDVTPELFETLTAPKFLPHIDEACAADLLSLHDYYQRQKNDDSKSGDHHLSNLQLRCVDALAKNWRRLIAPNDPYRYQQQQQRSATTAATDFLQEQNPVLLAELLRKSLKQANGELEEEKAKALTTLAATATRYHQPNAAASSWAATNDGGDDSKVQVFARFGPM